MKHCLVVLLPLIAPLLEDAPPVIKEVLPLLVYLRPVAVGF